MILHCLGSSSDGNCYLLKNDTECLVIENGIPFKEVKKDLDYNIMQIVGTIASHKHGDHHRYTYEYRTAGIPTFCPFEFKQPKNFVRFGGFTIQCFPLIHDVPCYGFYIRHKEMGKCLFVTDTLCVPPVFKDFEVNYILVECNYQDDLVDKNSANYEHKLRHHMSLDTCKNFIQANKTNALRTVILCHLGAETTIAEECITEVHKVANCPVYAAKKGMEIELSLTPF